MREAFSTLISILDIIVVALVFYRLYILVRGTRAALMLNGFLVILFAGLAAQWIGYRSSTRERWARTRVLRSLHASPALRQLALTVRRFQLCLQLSS